MHLEGDLFDGLYNVKKKRLPYIESQKVGHKCNLNLTQYKIAGQQPTSPSSNTTKEKTTLNLTDKSQKTDLSPKHYRLQDKASTGSTRPTATGLLSQPTPSSSPY
ncbi:hypothetical protein NXS19_004570 [Fusarium pseudograminearum]|nr:hypothetical protein NXS19_004570 [Fusarium pseudograminearum]